MSKRKTVIIFIVIFFVILLGIGFYVKRQYAVPILMYHSITPEARPENRLSVSVEIFDRQMAFLRRNNYNIVYLDELADLIKNKKKIPPRTIAITMDDGYKNNYIYAFPILKKYNIKATIFIIVNEVSRSQNDRLSWEEILKMRDSGIIAFGSHCLGPEPLVNIPSRELVIKEIKDSKRILESKIQRQIYAFSYPEGRFNNELKQLVRDSGYKVAVATNPGIKFANNDIYALKRIRISSTSDNLFVFWFESSGYYNFIREHRHK